MYFDVKNRGPEAYLSTGAGRSFTPPESCTPTSPQSLAARKIRLWRASSLWTSLTVSAAGAARSRVQRLGRNAGVAGAAGSLVLACRQRASGDRDRPLPGDSAPGEGRSVRVARPVGNGGR